MTGVWLLLALVAYCRDATPSTRSPITWPVTTLALMVTVGTLITPYPDLAMPKVASIVLGILAVRAMLLGVQSPTHAWRAAAGYVLLGCVLIAPAVIATTWFVKFTWLEGATAALPHVIPHLPGTAPEGVQPNALGGTTLFLLPLLVVIASATRQLPDTMSLFGVERYRHRAAVRVGLRAAFAVIIIGVTMVLLLTQSRTSWFAMAVAAVTLAALRWRPARRAAAAACLALILVIFLGPRSYTTAVWRAMSTVSTVSMDLSWAGRVEVWQSAVAAISDFPFTGVGLSAFRRIVHDLYPLTLSSANIDLAHAHNVFLQTALDVGLPGLVAYVSLLVVASVLAWQVYCMAAPPEAMLALGLWGNLLAVHLFGLADAIALGAKVGLLFWLDIGILVALHRCTVGTPLTAAGPDRAGQPA
jgi:putative inorganic carbon (HCO3(-)) transporter